ncbi:MAG: transposase [Planctomycetes bacterium]|nr:transposase [Planctomycetota bacterium]
MKGRAYYNVTLMLNRQHETRRLTTNTHAAVTREVLEDFARRSATVYVWMVMPDHIHILFSRKQPLRDVETFIGRVKQRINQGLERRGLPTMDWIDGAKQYPVTRRTLGGARDYILANPQRGQMVRDPADWPLKDTPAPLDA